MFLRLPLLVFIGKYRRIPLVTRGVHFSCVMFNDTRLRLETVWMHL